MPMLIVIRGAMQRVVALDFNVAILNTNVSKAILQKTSVPFITVEIKFQFNISIPWPSAQ